MAVRAWVPTDATSATIVGHLDAMDANSFTRDADNKVSAWYSRVGAWKVTQPTAANRPTYSATGYNNLPALLFTTNDHFLSTLTPSTFPVGAEAGVMSGVAPYPARIDTYTTMFYWGTANDKAARSIAATGEAVSAGYYGNDLIGNVRWTGFDRIFVSSITTTGLAQQWVDGGPVQQEQKSSINTPTGSTFWVGKSINGDPWRSPIQEIVLWKGLLSTEDRQKLEGYFAWRWNLVSQLPATHPYKSAAPTVTVADSYVPPITLIGTNSAQANTATMPPHKAGDLILVWAYQGANNTNVITLPSGYTATAALAGGAGNGQGARVGYRLATSDNESLGTWGDAEEVIVHVYRNVNQNTPIGSHNKMATVGDVTFAGITLTATDSRSWVVGFAGWRSIGNNLASATYPGLTLRDNVRSVAASSRSVSLDTNGAVTSFPTTSSSGATGSRYQTATIEIMPLPPAEGGTSNRITFTPSAFGIVGNPIGVSRGFYVSISCLAVATVLTDLSLKQARRLTLSPVSVVVTPSDGVFKIARTVAVAPGTFVASLQGVNLLRGFRFGMDAAQFSVTLNSFNILRGWTLSLSPAAYVSQTSEVGTRFSKSTTFAGGSYQINTNPLALFSSKHMVLEAQSHVLSLTDVGLKVSRRGDAFTPLNFGVGMVEGNFKLTRFHRWEVGVFSAAMGNLTTRRQNRIRLTSRSFNVTLNGPNSSIGYRFFVGSASFSVLPSKLGTQYSRRLILQTAPVKVEGATLYLRLLGANHSATERDYVASFVSRDYAGSPDSRMYIGHPSRRYF